MRINKNLNLKLILIFIIAIVMLSFNYKVKADGNIAEGTFGTNATWVIDSEGNMVIRPTTGDVCTIGSYTNSNAAPWNSYKSEIKTISFEGTVNSGNNSIGLFNFMPNLKTIDFTNFNTNGLKNMADMFRNDTSLENLDLSNFNTSNVTTMYCAFYNCSKLKNIEFFKNIESNSFKTLKVTDMSAMFYNCELLEKLDLSGFDTSNVTTMKMMFTNCRSLTNLDLNSFETSKVTEMSSMFINCRSLTNLDLNNFETSKVTVMNNMFRNCINLKKLDISSFNTSNVKNMELMFSGTNSLDYIDLSNFVITEETNVDSMLANIVTDITGAKKVVFGDNIKIGTKYGFFMRGTWKREEDNKEYTALEIYNMMKEGNAAGTYIKISNISKDVNIDFPVTYKINKINQIDSFTTSNTNMFEQYNNYIILKNIPKGEESVSIPETEKVDLLFRNVVTDKENNKYNLKLTINNINIDDIPTQIRNEDYIISILSVKDGIIKLSNEYYSDFEKMNNGIKLNTLVRNSSFSYDVEISIIDDHGNKQEGSYIFSAYDLDIPSAKDKNSEYQSIIDVNLGYGNYSEGVNLLEGFDLSTIKMFSPTNLILLKTDENKPDKNRITGTRTDGATELSEFMVKGDSRKTKITWTSGGEATTDLFCMYQPYAVEIQKQDENGNIIKGAKFELYYRDNKIDEFVSSENGNKFFLNPGKYTLKEIEAPYGYDKIEEEIDFYLDIDKIIANGEQVEKIIVKNKKSKTGKIVTKYVDENDNEIAEKIEEEKIIGTQYNTTKKDIEGYEYVKVIGTTEGQIQEETTYVTYVYKKISNPTEQVGSEQNKEDKSGLLSPKTGDAIVKSFIVLSVSIIGIIVCSILIKKRKGK